MKIKTSELTGAALDWAVAKCEHDELSMKAIQYPAYVGTLPVPHPSTDWSQGGPIIEREGISVITLEHEYGVDSEGYTTSKRIPVFGAVIGEYFDTDQQRNSIGEELVATGPTPLTAAMRCYVASKLGDEVGVPDEIARAHR